MIFKIKNHNLDLYSTLLNLSRNIFFYKEIGLKDSFETRIYLMFMHFSIILIIFKKNKIKYPQSSYDNLFFSIENNLRELGFGDVAVNKKLILKYFSHLEDDCSKKYELFDQYLLKFYHFCFELSPENMIKDAIKFKV